MKAQRAMEKGEQGVQLAELYYSTQTSSTSKLNENIRDLTARLDTRDLAITELQAKVWSGHFVWKIVNFDKLFKQASSGEVPAIHSVPFYSGVPGLFLSLIFTFLMGYVRALFRSLRRDSKINPRSVSIYRCGD